MVIFGFLYHCLAKLKLLHKNLGEQFIIIGIQVFLSPLENDGIRHVQPSQTYKNINCSQDARDNAQKKFLGMNQSSNESVLFYSFYRHLVRNLFLQFLGSQSGRRGATHKSRLLHINAVGSLTKWNSWRYFLPCCSLFLNINHNYGQLHKKLKILQQCFFKVHRDLIFCLYLTLQSRLHCSLL